LIGKYMTIGESEKKLSSLPIFLSVPLKYIAKNFNLPIIPVVSHNAHNLMVKGKVWLKSGEIKIEILDPIYNVNDYTVDELTSKMESLIKSRL